MRRDAESGNDPSRITHHSSRQRLPEYSAILYVVGITEIPENLNYFLSKLLEIGCILWSKINQKL
jgi:hypothetical protein